VPLVSFAATPYNSQLSVSLAWGGEPVQLDDHLKQLLRELGQAINDSISDSDRILEAIANVRAAGYDVVLKLDATVGLSRRDSKPARLSFGDRRFLESLRIRVDDETIEDDEFSPRFEFTQQDIKFLKSLKISLEDLP
jgi:hypothetical protein